MAPLLDTSVLQHDGATATATALKSMLSAAALATVAPLPFTLASFSTTTATTATTVMDTVDDSALATTDAHVALNVVDLPAVVLELMCAFVDHATLHAVEQTSTALREVVARSDLWRQIGSRQLVCLDTTAAAAMAGNSNASWKALTCVASRATNDHTKLLRDVVQFSSADRSSETPANTLTLSQCWRDLEPHLTGPTPQRLTDIHSSAAHFGLTLGERLQHTCGCSTGNSCYWSSSASSDQHAVDFIDYLLVDACVASVVELLPYRVFWHPESPTYAPQQVAFEFYDRTLASTTSDITDGATPFYTSPIYDVVNAMELQRFALPRKIVVRSCDAVVMRIKLLGRHQAQTFELPPWLQQTPADRLPKYYCCLSYVNVLGNDNVDVFTPATAAARQSAATNPLALVSQPLKEQSLRMANTLAEYMTTCYEHMFE